MQLLRSKRETRTLQACRLGFLRVTLAALVEAFARFQTGFLCSEKFHRMSKILRIVIDSIQSNKFSKLFIDLHSYISVDFYRYSYIFG